MRLERRARVRGLYVIVEPAIDATAGAEGNAERHPVEVARWALEGGARLIQLRDKRDKGFILPLARQIAALCQEYDALFIVNDHVDIAILADADGVHLGQHDLPIAEARRVLPDEMIVGVSTALLEEALAAREAGADYIAVGAMYPTGSKENTRPAGVETLRRVRERISDRPLVAIGGIDETNVTDVCVVGADAVAVIRAVSRAADVRVAAQRLVALMASGGIRT
jgi:thiamine-phosphate diphosphorylase